MITQTQIDHHLHLLQETLLHLRACRAALDDAAMTRQPGPGEWSALELLVHLRGCADVFSHTMYMCLVAQQPVVPYVHPNEWTTMQGYAALSFDENWQAFQLARQHLLYKVRTLTPEQWERSATIKTQTRTVYGEMRRMALHEKGHFGQISSLMSLQQ